MQHEAQLKVQKKKSLFAKVKKAFLQLFRLTSEPVVKVYHGYGNENKIVVFGHVLKLSPLPRTKYQENFWTNAFALLRSFMIVPKHGAKVVLQWDEKKYEAITSNDGFFRFECVVQNTVQAGMHSVKIEYIKMKKGVSMVKAVGEGWLVVPAKTQLAFISDIDDTFLISHSSNLRKRLYVLFTKNAHTRRPFEGVVNHYQLMAKAQLHGNGGNPFFYVSSSEWNLYDFIKEFCRTNDLPEGVFMLSQLKRFSKVLKTGGNKHATKFMRISRIMEAFPQHRFVLLGDDSQMDPTIYSSIVNYFPGRIKAVYLRHVYEKNLTNVNEFIKKIKGSGVDVCHFEHSSDAIEHSKSIGLI